MAELGIAVNGTVDIDDERRLVRPAERRAGICLASDVMAFVFVGERRYRLFTGEPLAIRTNEAVEVKSLDGPGRLAWMVTP